MDQTSVVVADDNMRIRAGIRSLLDSAPDIVVVGEAGDGIETLSAVDSLSPDVLVLDIEMPRMNGIKVAQELHTAGSPVQILVLSAHNDWQFIHAMLENGVAGYLIKDEVPEILLSAVRGIAHGQHGWFSSQTAAMITAGLRNTGLDRTTGGSHQVN
ncbi:MAG TPA: response regulator transcription factor [Anaerolineales bacterium]